MISRVFHALSPHTFQVKVSGQFGITLRPR
jgi:hypothetical protein